MMMIIIMMMITKRMKIHTHSNMLMVSNQIIVIAITIERVIYKQEKLKM